MIDAEFWRKFEFFLKNYGGGLLNSEPDLKLS